MRHKILILLAAVTLSFAPGLGAPANAATGQLTTAPTDGSSWHGASADLTVAPAGGVQITGLDLNLYSATQTSVKVTVMSRPGTVAGHEDSLDGWVTRSYAVVPVTGFPGSSVSVPVAFHLAQGNQGVAIVIEGGAVSLKQGEPTYSDANLSLTGRSGLGFPLASADPTVANLPGYSFVGTVHYRTVLSQTLTFTSTPPANPTVGSSYTVAATGGASGNPVFFLSWSTDVCAVSGSTVQFVNVGLCTIVALQSGNDDYTAAPIATQTINVTKRAQAITFTTRPPTDALPGGAYVVRATSTGSSNPVVFSSLTPTTCTISMARVEFRSPGTCTVAANKAGTSSYGPAPQVTQGIQVHGGDPRAS